MPMPWAAGLHEILRVAQHRDHRNLETGQKTHQHLPAPGIFAERDSRRSQVCGRAGPVPHQAEAQQ